jgi:hypothetical protein
MCTSKMEDSRKTLKNTKTLRLIRHTVAKMALGDL